MFNIGGGEVLVIALIALIVVGPEQLPGVLRKAGRYANQFRSMTTSLRQEFMSGMDELDPTKWDQERGSGTPDSPIVPRGFAGEKADKTPGAPIKPVSGSMAEVPADTPEVPTSSNSIANANSSAGLAAGRAAAAEQQERAEAEAAARHERIAAEVQAEVDALDASKDSNGDTAGDTGGDPAGDTAVDGDGDGGTA